MATRANRWGTTASIVAFLVALVAAAWVAVAPPLSPTSPQPVVAAGPVSTVAPATPGPRGAEPPPAPLAPTASVTTSLGPVTTGLVRFVYFVEQDQEFDPGAEALITQQALALQQFWFDQFGGTFVVATPVDVVYGEHPAAWYDTTPIGDDPRWYRLTNIRDEIHRHLGIDPDDTTFRFVAYPSARIDGRVGANRYGGAVMDGDDLACISGAVDTTPYSADYPADCLATVAHELGHVFGLSHEGPDEDCMQFGFYRYVAAEGTCQFSAANRSLVINDPYNAPWLAATPGLTGPTG